MDEYEYQDVAVGDERASQLLTIYKQTGWDMVDFRQNDQSMVRLRRNLNSPNYPQWQATQERLQRQLLAQDAANAHHSWLGRLIARV